MSEPGSDVEIDRSYLRAYEGKIAEDVNDPLFRWLTDPELDVIIEACSKLPDIQTKRYFSRNMVGKLRESSESVDDKELQDILNEHIASALDAHKRYSSK